MLAFCVSGLSGGHVLSSGLLSLQKAGILKKMIMPTQWTGLTIIKFLG
jgi:hypothetical protein